MFKRGALLLPSVSSLAPTVAVAEGTRQSGTIAFGTRDAGAPTSLAETALYGAPSAPGGKPPAVRRIVVRYPPGFRIDTSVPAQCAESDAELQAQGGAACPADSRVGAGGTELATGFPGPGSSFDLDLEVYNNRDELIFLAKPRGSDVVVSVGRSAVGAGTLTTEIPPTPGGPPDGQASVRRIAVSLEEISKRAG